MFLIKVRKKTNARGAPWWFLGMEGRLVRLRLHACQFKSEKVDEVIARVLADNPEYEAKKQPY